MHLNLLRVSLTIVVGMASHFALATTVSFTAVRDNSIFSDVTANSNGIGGSFHTGRSGGTGVRRGLIAFDIGANVPNQATINSVQLTLTLTESANQGVLDPATVTLHRLLAGWGEGTSFTAEGGMTGMGIAATTGDATWFNRFHDVDPPIAPTPWTNAGGDFVALASASQAINKLSATPALNVYTWQSAGMVADVQGWLDDPSVNFGWILIGDESVIRTTRRFGSKDSSIENLRPVLTVDFTVVPEPNAAILVILGTISLAAGLRRRRSSMR